MWYVEGGMGGREGRGREEGGRREGRGREEGRDGGRREGMEGGGRGVESDIMVRFSV